MEVQETRVQTDRVLTIPNILSMARLVGVPVFLWLILRPEFGGPKSDGWALLVLMLSGVSDYLDGKLARRWNQISSLGRLLDPAADRLYILSTLVGLTWREILPLWLTAVLLARELVLLVVVAVLRRHGYPPLQVNFLGKAATFNLMYAFLCCCSATEADGSRHSPRFSDGRSPGGVQPSIGGQESSTWSRSAGFSGRTPWPIELGPIGQLKCPDGPHSKTAGQSGRVKSARPSSLQGGRFRHEGRRDGRRRRHTPSSYDLKHAQAAPAGGEPPDHGARAAAAQRHGLNETVVTVQFLASLVKNYFGDGEELGMELTYANEEKPLGTAGSVKNAEEALKDDTFLVISGDALTDFDLTDLINFHKEKGAMVTVCLTRVPNPLNSASPSWTKRARSSASWRSPPGARSSPTPSTRVST